MALLDKIVRLNFPGKKHISRVGMPLIAVAKIKKKTFLGTSHAIFNVQWSVFFFYSVRYFQ